MTQPRHRSLTHAARHAAQIGAPRLATARTTTTSPEPSTLLRDPSLAPSLSPASRQSSFVSKIRSLTSRYALLRLAAVAAGLVLLGLAGLSLTQRYLATHVAKPIHPAVTVTTSTQSPSEAPVADDYQVAPNAPRLISLPTIQAQGYIQPVGLDQTNAVAVPQNIHLAGWFVGQARPGEPGLSLIDAHVAGHYQLGLFAHLAQLRVGDTFIVQYGDYTTRTFRVRRVTTVPLDQAASAMLARDPTIRAQLNLITCAGTYATATGYDHRTIVIAERI